MSVYDLILQRRTIRKFKQQPIPFDLMEKMINAARLAPSASNLQPCEYIIVNDEHLLNQVFNSLKWAAYIAPAGDPQQEERPVAYIIILINSEINDKSGVVDASAAIENIILTALEQDIGCCWLYSVNRTKIRNLFSIPEKFQINSVLALGYPDESPVIEELKDSVEYWKDENKVLHVPKRKLEDIMHHNKF